MAPAGLDFYDQAFEWLEDLVFPNPQTVYLIQIAATFLALSWLFWRGWQVVLKPAEDLIEILGLDVPAAPQVSLSGVKSDSVILHWLRPDNDSSIAKYLIQVNGVNVGESSRTETGITVDGLKPDHFYSVQVIAVNAVNHQTSSPTLQLKTYAPEGPHATTEAAAPPKDDEDPGYQGGRLNASSGGARLHSPAAETPQVAATLPAIPREHSGTQAQVRRLTGGRRNSPANLPLDPSAASPQERNSYDDSLVNDHETTQALRYLTEKLETIRLETVEIQHQVQKEEEEFNTQRDALIQERDRIRHAVKEKDDASAELKKEASQLDRQNRHAQSQKAAKVKELQQKQNQRQRMQDEIERWDKEAEQMLQRQEDIGEQISTVRDQASVRLSAIREKIAEEHDIITEMEEEIKVKGALIKEAEGTRKKSQGSEDDSTDRDRDKIEEEESQKWEQRRRELQTMLSRTTQELQKARQNYQAAQDRLLWWLNSGNLNGHQQPTSQIYGHEDRQEDLISRIASQRTNLSRQSRTSTLSSTPGFSLADSRYSLSPTFAPKVPESPFFNVNNGMAVPQGSDRIKMDDADIEQLTGGAPMSPTANLLIPSNLLGDDDTAGPQLGTTPSPAHVGPPFGGSQLSSYGAAGQDHRSFDPSSPQSSEGRAASIFSSPRESLRNLGSYHSESFVENDTRSLHSTAGSIGPIGTPPSDDSTPSTKRFTNLFSLNLSRQRGRTVGNEGPAVGSLKAGQSQSFPLSMDGAAELDPIGTRRRRGSHTGGWASSLNFLNRSNGTKASEGDESGPSEGSSQVKRRAFNMFSSRYDPLEPSTILAEPSSPRPASTASGENAFPRPSSESQPFGWPVNPAGIHRSSPLYADWSIREGDPLSRGPSRRGSVHFGSTSSLSLQKSPFDPEAAQNRLSKKMSPPASIETPAQQSPKIVTPRLNPAAPTFRTLFARGDAKKAGKAKEKEQPDSLAEEASPPTDHKGRDSQSIHTQASQTESRDSLDRSTSATPIDSAANGTPKDKESIFQKITRKGSSNKFNLSRRDKSGLFSKKTDSPTPDEVEEEHGGESQLGKSVDSVVSTPSVGGRTSISWSSFRRKPKKGDKAASEASEKASETGEDDDGLLVEEDD